MIAFAESKSGALALLPLLLQFLQLVWLKALETILVEHLLILQEFINCLSAQRLEVIWQLTLLNKQAA